MIHEISPSEAVERLQAQFVWNYTNLSGCTIAIIDFLQTFPEEVRLMWPARLSIPKVLFYLARYLTLANNISSVFLSPGISRRTVKECNGALNLTGLLSPSAVVSAEAILFYRVWAFSGKSRRMLAYLIIQFIGLHSLVFYSVGKWLMSVKYARWSLPSTADRPICMVMEANEFLLSWTYAALLSSVISSMVIMVFIAYREHRGSSNRLLTVFYQDGVYYFVVLAIMASANVAVNWLAYGGYKYILIQFEVDLHGILSTRMLLHLRQIGTEFDAVSVTRIARIDRSQPVFSKTSRPFPRIPQRMLSPLHFRAQTTAKTTEISEDTPGDIEAI
ncbi:hypothetical protein DFP72DRAFT_1061975 [Ephemerocybe angulata]|uniref:DUF6533 domain-containing protein n=1 Tax=Ephemerocybe angulata TaxID=980116 RepID=A0A8H6ICM5_9AGAR|nr:hypothetical protein DFP72DRAFT_1061975 [Tulosesus angulatus]